MPAIDAIIPYYTTIVTRFIAGVHWSTALSALSAYRVSVVPWPSKTPSGIWNSLASVRRAIQTHSLTYSTLSLSPLFYRATISACSYPLSLSLSTPSLAPTLYVLLWPLSRVFYYAPPLSLMRVRRCTRITRLARSSCALLASLPGATVKVARSILAVAPSVLSPCLLLAFLLRLCTWPCDAVCALRASLARSAPKRH